MVWAMNGANRKYVMCVHTVSHRTVGVMAMKKIGVSLMVMVVVVVLVVVELPHMTEAVTCSPVALSPCMGAITSSAPPSSECCQKLKAQKPCLCGYLKNPSFKQYVNSPGAKKVISTCGISFPSC
ncbi:hypothetical protein K1719_000705 [Acacia pycnantha]|nr:hypothetical protein K1719_000705 [Acacia pycnantha]